MNSTGKNIVVSFSGESHSEKITTFIDGIKKGTAVSIEKIQKDLEARNPKLFFNSQRQENDKIVLVSGISSGKATGEIIVCDVYNEYVDKKDYEKHEGFLRPSHADYTRLVKNRQNPSSGGGASSGRMTIPVVIAGSIAKQILLSKGVFIISHIQSVYNISEENFTLENLGNFLQNKEKDLFFPTISSSFHENCFNLLKTIQKEKDSVGGKIETAILNLSPGVGEPFFNSLESEISRMLFSIPAVKAVEFGDGVEFVNKKGSEVEDSFYFDNKTQKIRTKENHNGGINGGISNGMPIIIKTSIKPVPTIKKPITSYNYLKKTQETVEFSGNYDVFVGNRAIPAVEGVIALAVLDSLYEEEKKV
ncbi:MAG: chorismate synthase [Bacillales bacterium]|nr:chorismate synthase [Bacillales bacterium]